MKIKDLKLIPPSKRATAFFRNFMREHDKGLKAIKTLAEIKEIAILNWSDNNMGFMCNQILQKINEVENED